MMGVLVMPRHRLMTMWVVLVYHAIRASVQQLYLQVHGFVQLWTQVRAAVANQKTPMVPTVTAAKSSSLNHDMSMRVVAAKQEYNSSRSRSLTSQHHFLA